MLVSTLLYNAFRIAGVLGAAGRGASPSEISDGMLTLNAMLDAWATERLLIWCILQNTVDLVVSQQNYSIGTNGVTDYELPRPEGIDRAGLIVNNVTPSTEIPLQIYSDQEWAAVTPKQLQSTQPTGLWYQRTVPNGIITYWPIPQYAYQVNLYLRVNLLQVPGPTANIDLPPGYQTAIEYNLAVELAARFQERANIRQFSIEKAGMAKATIKIMNDEHLKMRVEYAALGTAGRRGRYQILSNTYYGGGD